MQNKTMKNNHTAHPYEDIIHLPRPVSKTHPPMPIADRAAQFAPFAALNGHGDLIRKTQRLHEESFENNSCNDAESYI